MCLVSCHFTPLVSCIYHGMSLLFVTACVTLFGSCLETRSRPPPPTHPHTSPIKTRTCSSLQFNVSTFQPHLLPALLRPFPSSLCDLHCPPSAAGPLCQAAHGQRPAAARRACRAGLNSGPRGQTLHHGLLPAVPFALRPASGHAAGVRAPGGRSTRAGRTPLAHTSI